MQVPIDNSAGALQPMDLSYQVRSSLQKEEVLLAPELMRNKFGFRNHPLVLRESILNRVLHCDPFDPISRFLSSAMLQ
ncbi:hypothetical protein Gotri_006529 [Gossypium trilobum]|uniref:Uncharacterized protein n=1 Tax=Gossypium trilobum TaxID=34281 RepID=A0A7J9F0C6_9ROSI|nr:hypothetical protein [Gossypium trilobum]